MTYARTKKGCGRYVVKRRFSQTIDCYLVHAWDDDALNELEAEWTDRQSGATLWPKTWARRWARKISEARIVRIKRGMR